MFVPGKGTWTERRRTRSKQIRIRSIPSSDELFKTDMCQNIRQFEGVSKKIILTILRSRLLRHERGVGEAGERGNVCLPRAEGERERGWAESPHTLTELTSAIYGRGTGVLYRERQRILSTYCTC